MSNEESNTANQSQEKESSSLSNLEVLSKHTNELEWLLEQQSKLRSEYIAFYKKDLKEIHSSLGDVLSGDNNGGPLIERVIAGYTDKLSKSMSLLDIDLWTTESK